VPDPLRDLYAGLAALLRAGLTARDAIRVLRGNGTLRGAHGRALADAVEAGRPISSALRAPPDEVAIVAAGEETGRLDANLERLAEQRGRREARRRALLRAVRYPLLVLHAAALLVPLPFTFWRPGFPSTWLFWAVVTLAPFYAVYFLARLLRRTPEGQARLQRMAEWLPGYRTAARHARRATFAEVLGAAHDAGIPFDRGLALAATAAGAPYARAAAALVARGSPVAEALRAAGVFDDAGLARLQTAEIAGDLGPALARLATDEQAIADHALERALFLTAKGFYLLVAAGVVAYALAIFAGIGSAAAPFLR
jgi:type II secretory pathway component PulF